VKERVARANGQRDAGWWWDAPALKQMRHVKPTPRMRSCKEHLRDEDSSASL
jgi:hypothetical protein